MVNTRLEETGQKPISPNSHQWYRIGEKCELAFIDKMSAVGFDCIINPDKKVNKKLPDLYVNGRLADLKTQLTHFYSSGKHYSIHPTKVVTINHKDVHYYSTCYPDLDIYIWLYKQGLERKEIILPSMDEVWCVHIQTLLKLCETAPTHSYSYRRDATGQAKCSYVLSTDNFIRII